MSYLLVEKNSSDTEAGRIKSAVDLRLTQLVGSIAEAPVLLSDAVAYSVLGPGKRVRPILTLLTSSHFGARSLQCLDFACAVEMVHAASLVMDDLPAMDDAKLRRGKPTVHLKHGEDLAMLSVVALINLAYSTIATTPDTSEDIRLSIVKSLAHAIGGQGLVGGQTRDLQMQNGDTGATEAEKTNAGKTGQLFASAMEIGALAAKAPKHHVGKAREAGLELGMAFQIADDILDGFEFDGQTGKDTGKDLNKRTLARIVGSEASLRRFDQHVAKCRDCLSDMNGSDSALFHFVETCFSKVRP